MRLVIAGPRDLCDPYIVVPALWQYPRWLQVTEIVHGDAKGVDSVVRQIFTGWLPVTPFPAQWRVYGKYAGPMRNALMAAYGDELLAVRRGYTPGTANMIRTMQAHGKPVFIQEVLS